MAENRTSGGGRSKPPRKPYPTFPLNAHRNGQWYATRRIGGAKQFFYFGRWADDPDGAAAFAAWQAVAEDLRAGRMPATTTAPTTGIGPSCEELADRYTAFARARLDLGEIGPREFYDVRLACMGHWLDGVGERTPAADLNRSRLVPGRADPVTPMQLMRERLGRKLGPYAVNRNLDKIARMLRWAFKHGLIAKPLDDHDGLKRVSLKARRRHQRTRDAEKGVPALTPAECLQLIEPAAAKAAAGGSHLALLLLALNGGCSSSWLSEVPLSAVDLDGGFVDWVRPKTEELCRFPLWPLTIEAIRQWLPHRPAAREPGHGDRVFLTRLGNPLVRSTIPLDDDGDIASVNPDDAWGKELDKLIRAAGFKRPGLRSHALRRSHSTAANDVLDRDARRMVMGHGFEGMDPHYVRGLFPAARLKVVTDHVGHVLLGCVATSCAFPRTPAAAGSPMPAAGPAGPSPPTARAAG